MIPKASEDLLGYKRWRESLVPLEVGTVLHWVTGYNSTTSYSIKPGQYTKITIFRKSNGPCANKTTDYEYSMVQCDKNGKEFKRKFCWSVEGIARKLHDNEIEVM